MYIYKKKQTTNIQHFAIHTFLCDNVSTDKLILGQKTYTKTSTFVQLKSKK